MISSQISSPSVISLSPGTSANEPGDPLPSHGGDEDCEKGTRFVIHGFSTSSSMLVRDPGVDGVVNVVDDMKDSSDDVSSTSVSNARDAISNIVGEVCNDVNGEAWRNPCSSGKTQWPESPAD